VKRPIRDLEAARIGARAKKARELAELLAAMEAARALVACAGDPCYDCACCACCARWSQALELLQAAARHHVAGELRLVECHPDCLICGAVSWQRPS
jgi:hypothetical protein